MPLRSGRGIYHAVKQRLRIHLVQDLKAESSLVVVSHWKYRLEVELIQAVGGPWSCLESVLAIWVGKAAH